MSRSILDQTLADIGDRGLVDGAVVVVNHQSDEILAWVNGGGMATALPGGWIDAVTTPRQPGSTLKPFLYGLALERGWTASTIINDSPLARPIGSGIHPFRNYSRRYYGPLRLREALGNSLNIPAVRTIQAIGVEAFLARLHELGFASLSRPANHYGEGLALGNGEITLFELVQAYAVLARGGLARPLRFTLDGRQKCRCPDREDLQRRGGVADRRHPCRPPGPAARVRRRQYPPNAGADGGQDRDLERFPRRLGRRFQPSLYGGDLDGQS